jgi:hypothetical protein
MAGLTNTAGCRTGIYNQAAVSCVLVSGINTAMTIYAGNLAMNRGIKILPQDEHFFPWLQRSHLAPSAGSGGFFFDHLFRFGCIDETLLVGVTSSAFI